MGPERYAPMSPMVARSAPAGCYSCAELRGCGESPEPDRRRGSASTPVSTRLAGAVLGAWSSSPSMASRLVAVLGTWHVGPGGHDLERRARQAVEQLDEWRGESASSSTTSTIGRLAPGVDPLCHLGSRSWRWPHGQSNRTEPQDRKPLRARARVSAAVECATLLAVFRRQTDSSVVGGEPAQTRLKGPGLVPTTP